jgi:hypothetical protein
MTPGTVRDINLALAEPQLARAIVLLAQTPLDAVYAAGIELNGVEEEFLRRIPGAMWTDVKAHIIAAHTAGHTPELSIEPAGAYGFSRKAPEEGVVSIVLAGPVSYDSD